MNETALGVQMVVGVLFAFVLQLLKKARWFPWLTEHSAEWWKIGSSVLVAAASAFAINFDWNASAGVLTISGLTWDHVGKGLMEFLISFMSQQAGYGLLVKKLGPTPLTVDVSKVGKAVLILALLPALHACADKTKAYHADRTIVTVLANFQDAELTLHQQGVIGDDAHGRISLRFGDAWRLARDYNALVRDWPGTKPAPAQLVLLAGGISTAMVDILALLPPSDAVATLRAFANEARTIVQIVLAAADPSPTAAPLLEPAP